MVFSAEAWITSSGTNAGVMKYVGEAVRDLVMGQALQARVVALGIAPWGCVQNKQILVQKGVSWFRCKVRLWPDVTSTLSFLIYWKIRIFINCYETQIERWQCFVILFSCHD